MPRKKAEDKIQPRGVGLKLTEWEDIDQIAADLGITPHALAAYGLRYFLKAWHEGKVKAKERKTFTLPDL